MNSVSFFKSLSDPSRLNLLFLLLNVDEACVCDLTEALALDQPKTSRLLSDLRKIGVLQDNRRGKWVYYSLHPNLPTWCRDVLSAAAVGNAEQFREPLTRLNHVLANQNRCC